MSVNVPVPTIDKPITVIDYIAALHACRTSIEVAQFSEAVPMAVRVDDRFARAVLDRLNGIKESRRKRA